MADFLNSIDFKKVLSAVVVMGIILYFAPGVLQALFNVGKETGRALAEWF